MAIDYSGFAFPKTRVKALDQADRTRARTAQDKAENAKAKRRAQGTCEVFCLVAVHPARGKYVGEYQRCRQVDTATHHLIGGIGRRNRGKSILAAYKLRVCAKCHDAITKNILRPTTAEHTAETVRYWRAR